MKHNLKQALTTAALLLCSMVAMAQTTATVGGITYEFDATEKTAKVVASKSGSYTGNITIPETVKYYGVVCNVTAIGDGAFYYCDHLTNVIIGNNVTTIGEDAFSGCKRLTSVTIPNNVTTIAEDAFSGCDGLTSITIPNSVTTIGDYAFYGCSGLTSITIPNSVTTIGIFAFQRCSGLETVVIGEGVKTINYEAFASCRDLTDIYCLATSVPSTNGTAFNNSYIEFTTLHVPEESINSYKNTAPWSGFGTIKAIANEIELTYEFDATEKTAKVVASKGDSYTGNI